MSQDIPRKRGKNTHFWRACRYLGPYRRLVITSIVSAFFVGFILTGGLSAMLPMIKVLIEGQTIQGWIDQRLFEKRVGVTIADREDRPPVVVRIDKNSAAEQAGVKVGARVVGELPRVTADEFRFRGDASDPIRVRPKPLPFYLRWIHTAAWMLPVRPVAAIGAVFAIMACLALLGNVIRFFQEYFSDKAAISAVMDIRRHLYDHVLHMPMSFFGMSGTSDVTSRLVQDSVVLQEGFKITLGQSVQEPIKAAFAFLLSLFISWKLTLFMVIFAPIMAVVIRKFGKKMRRASRAALQRSSSMLGQIEGTLGGIRVVKGASAERFERRRYAQIMQGLRFEQLKMARYEALATPAMEMTALILVGLVLMYAAYLVFETKPPLPTSSLIMVMTCLMFIGESLRKFSKLTGVLARSNSAAARIFEILDVPVERARNVRAISAVPSNGNGAVVGQRINLPPLAREIRFEDVSFAYSTSPTLALDDVSLRVKKGTSIAIVGRNGSGKTTLLALLPRFYSPQAGRIFIDDIDIRRATLRSLRGQIGIVTQEAVIFPGTIAQNIAYGLPLASREEIEAAAKRAFAHDFILEKPQGYDTILGEMGGQLSGGQRQRINIARAILRKTPILILDEATSQVDAESEHLIQQAIESIMHERTTFVIAHRFSTILSADTIVVMDRGKIVAQGEHEELLETCETYKHLYERQLVLT